MRAVTAREKQYIRTQRCKNILTALSVVAFLGLAGLTEGESAVGTAVTALLYAAILCLSTRMWIDLDRLQDEREAKKKNA